MIVVSACLAGVKCRYNGMAFSCPVAQRLVTSGQAVLVCPELLGGLPIPRPAAEIVGGRVISFTGQDVTASYQKGAAIALQMTLASGCNSAILKARSPSCGSGQVYDGSFSNQLIPGDGIFAMQLKAGGIRVQTEEEVSPEDE